MNNSVKTSWSVQLIITTRNNEPIGLLCSAGIWGDFHGHMSEALFKRNFPGVNFLLQGMSGEMSEGTLQGVCLDPYTGLQVSKCNSYDLGYQG